MTPDKDKVIDLNTPEAELDAARCLTRRRKPRQSTSPPRLHHPTRLVASPTTKSTIVAAAMLSVITTVRPVSRAFTSRARTRQRCARAHSHLSPRHHRRRGRRNRARDADTAARRTQLAMLLVESLLFVPWKIIEKYLFCFQKLPPREVKHSPPRWMIWREKNLLSRYQYLAWILAHYQTTHLAGPEKFPAF